MTEAENDLIRASKEPRICHRTGTKLDHAVLVRAPPHPVGKLLYWSGFEPCLCLLGKPGESGKARDRLRQRPTIRPKSDLRFCGARSRAAGRRACGSRSMGGFDHAEEPFSPDSLDGNSVQAADAAFRAGGSETAKDMT